MMTIKENGPRPSNAIQHSAPSTRSTPWSKFGEAMSMGSKQVTWETEGEPHLVSVQNAPQKFLLGFRMVFGRDRPVRLIEFGYESFDVPRNRFHVISKSLD
jgi:hypothetical protein